jgi:hypothetical protein
VEIHPRRRLQHSWIFASRCAVGNGAGCRRR